MWSSTRRERVVMRRKWGCVKSEDRPLWLLTPRFGLAKAREWRTGQTWESSQQIEIVVPPGESRYVEFDAP
jgi:hypothetical protein